jgi:8-oxo-dGTP pyrophosphatase MutT (NUDIX family)
MDDQVVFACPWFELVAKRSGDDGPPHYSIRTQDYVAIVATTEAGRLLLVRQFRPAVEMTTLELPSGHVEPGETPIEAARRELLEETGHTAATLELLGELRPDTGRLGNRLWCFHTSAVPAPDSGADREHGVKAILYDGTLSELLARPDFCCAQHLGAVLLAISRGRLSPT